MTHKEREAARRTTEACNAAGVLVIGPCEPELGGLGSVLAKATLTDGRLAALEGDYKLVPGGMRYTIVTPLRR